MFKVLIIQALNDLSDERVEFLIADRLSFMRVLGLSHGDKGPDHNTIWTFRQHLGAAKINGTSALDRLFERFDRMIKEQGYLAMGGQIVDASIVAAPKQRLTQDEKAAAKAGKSANEIWPDQPNKASHKDVNARWTIKYSRAKAKSGGAVPKGHVDIAIPSFGYKNHISTDVRFGFIRAFDVTDAATYDGNVFRDLITQNTASGVWADTAYNNQRNRHWLERHGKVNNMQTKKPKGRAMSDRQRFANAKLSGVRSKVEHVFGRQKSKFGMNIRTIGIDRARIKLGLINLAYNMCRYLFHERRGTLA